MALPAVLSAIREIILNEPELPRVEGERRLKIRAIFPQLTAEEADDLARINPDGFTVYTSSIFSGERNLLFRNFPMTIEYLRRNWKVISQGDFDILSLTKAVHRKYPWKSSSPVELCRNFKLFIKSELGEIVTAAPFIPDVAKLELMLRIVRRSPDNEIMPTESLQAEELARLTVGEVLSRSFIIPTFVELSTFSYDAVAARSEYLSQGKFTPETVSERVNYQALSRNRDCDLKWCELPRPIFLFLSKSPRAQKIPLSDLAEEFISTSAAAEDEQAAFREFIGLVANSINSGVMIIQ